MYIYTNIHNVYTYDYTYICIYRERYIDIDIYVCIYIYIYFYIHTYIHIHIWPRAGAGPRESLRCQRATAPLRPSSSAAPVAGGQHDTPLRTHSQYTPRNIYPRSTPRSRARARARTQARTHEPLSRDTSCTDCDGDKTVRKYTLGRAGDWKRPRSGKMRIARRGPWGIVGFRLGTSSTRPGGIARTQVDRDGGRHHEDAPFLSRPSTRTSGLSEGAEGPKAPQTKGPA